MPDPSPFACAIPDREIADLKTRLALTRLPDQAPGAGWTYGADLAFMRRVLAYWQDGYDWRATEAQLNALPQFTVPLDGIGLHFIHVRGKGPDPLPVLLSHGWPGSVLEFLDVIPRLTDPARFGGDPADAVSIVAPSLPGYALSYAPGQKRYGVEEIADVLATLMSDVLGYDRFAAQGGDWGSHITARLAHVCPERLVGIHLNMLALPPDVQPANPPSAEEAAHLERMRALGAEEMAYHHLQGTKPQTLAYGLSDSPAGLAAWIFEKLRSWTDCDGDPETILSLDRMLGLVSLYWFTSCIGASFHPYYARRHRPFPVPEPVRVPTGVAIYPKEIMRPPRSMARQLYPDIRHWSEMPRGGHFAAMEQPALLAGDLLDFLRPLR